MGRGGAFAPGTYQVLVAGSSSTFRLAIFGPTTLCGLRAPGSIAYPEDMPDRARVVIGVLLYGDLATGSWRDVAGLLLCRGRLGPLFGLMVRICLIRKRHSRRVGCRVRSDCGDGAAGMPSAVVLRRSRWRMIARSCWRRGTYSRAMARSTGAPTFRFTEWKGVTVPWSSRRVERLDLRNRGLTGSIPPEMGNLTALQALFLSGNSLTGVVPPELEKMLPQLHPSPSDGQFVHRLRPECPVDGDNRGPCIAGIAALYRPDDDARWRVR